MKNKLKLFVWKEFNPDYTYGIAFAIAENEEEAKELIVKERGINVHEWGILTVYPLKEKRAFSVSGGG